MIQIEHMHLVILPSKAWPDTQFQIYFSEIGVAILSAGIK